MYTYYKWVVIVQLCIIFVVHIVPALYIGSAFDFCVPLTCLYPLFFFFLSTF